MLPPHKPYQGLSPRVRGNLDSYCGVNSRLGSIPACAGEPDDNHARQVKPQVYPRVCGGTELPATRRRKTAGLSPRVRGNPPRFNHAGAVSRSIPACAGEPGVRNGMPQ